MGTTGESGCALAVILSIGLLQGFLLAKLALFLLHPPAIAIVPITWLLTAGGVPLVFFEIKILETKDDYKSKKE